jgi:hypothetical protein
MRKTFMIAFSVTALVALVIGGAYTWTTGATGGGEFASGSISGAIVNVEPTGNVLYPLGQDVSDYIPVLQGDIKNTTPANPGIAIHAVAGGGNVTGGGGCGVTGWVMEFADQNAIPPGQEGNHWTWSAAMPESAPDSCQSQSFTTTLFVSLST